MSIRYVKGDLFTYDGLDAIGHGCNCKGAMGSGIAYQFAKRYPRMDRAYSERCDNGLLKPGMIFPWTQDKPVIVNMMTQEFPGPDARGMWIAQALDAAMKFCETLFSTRAHAAVLGIPEIGSGIGGLSQDYCHYIFEETAQRNPDVDLIVVQWEALT